MIEHEQTGYLADPFEPADLAKGIAWVTEDEQRWKKLSQCARQKVEREFDVKKVAKRYLSLYEEILGTTGAGESEILASARD